MATVQEALKQEEVSTFYGEPKKPSNNSGFEKKQGFIEGEYLGHISNVRSVVRPVLKKYKARIYNYDVIVSDENKKMNYSYEDIAGDSVNITGEQFANRKLIAKGIFKFLDPVEGDDFEGNSSENLKYMRFCETLGLAPTEETRTVDGKETKVKLLPVLTEDDMVGKPVTAVLRRYKDSWVNNKGQKMNYSWRVSYVKPWESGAVKKMTVDPEDLPF